MRSTVTRPRWWIKSSGGEKLDPAQVRELSRSGSADVRFMVARNPHLAPEEIDLFISDGNDFARSGAACNPGLTPAQIDQLTRDSSHTVYCQLAGNTALSEEALLRIHRQRNPGLVWFAMNPNCPASIRKEIEGSQDDLARRWLEITDGWKRDGVYRQNDAGRWYKPPDPNRHTS